MNINKALKTCFEEKIKVYPVIVGKKHKIEYSKNGVIIKRYAKILDTYKAVNDAMEKTYIFLAKKLIEKK